MGGLSSILAHMAISLVCILGAVHIITRALMPVYKTNTCLWKSNDQKTNQENTRIMKTSASNIFLFPLVDRGPELVGVLPNVGEADGGMEPIQNAERRRNMVNDRPR